MKESLKYLGWLLFLLLVVFLSLRGCSKPPCDDKIEVIVPKIDGKFEAKKPVHKAVTDKYSITQKPKKKQFQSKVPITKNITIDKNSIIPSFSHTEGTNIEMIREKSFYSKFEDENVILNINGIVDGEVKEITPNYTLKERKLPIAVPVTTFRLLGGGSFGVNKELNKFAYKLNLDFQNKKGNTVSLEYLRLGSESFGMIGVKRVLFDVKR